MENTIIKEGPCLSTWIVICSKRNLLQWNKNLFVAGSDFSWTLFSTIHENRILDSRQPLDELHSSFLYCGAVSPQHIGSRKGFLQHRARAIVLRQLLGGTAPDAITSETISEPNGLTVTATLSSVGERCGLFALPGKAAAWGLGATRAEAGWRAFGDQSHKLRVRYIQCLVRCKKYTLHASWQKTLVFTIEYIWVRYKWVQLCYQHKWLKEYWHEIVSLRFSRCYGCLQPSNLRIAS